MCVVVSTCISIYYFIFPNCISNMLLCFDSDSYVWFFSPCSVCCFCFNLHMCFFMAVHAYSGFFFNLHMCLFIVVHVYNTRHEFYAFFTQRGWKTYPEHSEPLQLSAHLKSYIFFPRELHIKVQGGSLWMSFVSPSISMCTSA